MAYPRFRQSRAHKRIRYVSGSITLNQTAWTDLVAAGALDIVLRAQVGDDLEYGLSGIIGNTAVESYFDVVTVVSGAPVNSFAQAGPVVPIGTGAYGVSGWYTSASRQDTLSGSAWYTVVAGDLSGGKVTLRPRYADSAATARTLFASANNPFLLTAKNLGPPSS